MHVSLTFVKRLAEQAGTAALGAFAAVLSSSAVSVDKALLIGALTAALRAAYGVVVKTFGDPEQPSVTK